MIQIELIDHLPDLPWSEQALFEQDLHGMAHVEQATRMYQVGQSAVLGFTHSSLTSPPWLWFMLAREVLMSDLKALKRSTFRIPTGTRTCVQSGYEVGERFAQFFGFVPTGDSFTLQGMHYNIFRRV